MSSVIPVVGVALGALAARATHSLSHALSFADVFASAPAQQPAGSQATVPPEAQDSSSKLSQLRQQVETSLQRFQQTLQSRLSTLGVDPSRPVNLEDDGLGGIRVGGEHPQRAYIEQLLADDASLSGQFQELSRLFQSIRDTETPPEFRHSRLRSIDRLSLTIQGDEASAALI
jgi:hypothetical protein